MLRLSIRLIPLIFLSHMTFGTAELGSTWAFHQIPQPPSHPVIQQAPAYTPTYQPTTQSSITGYLPCVRFKESSDNYEWGYPTGTGDGGGAYQFERGTWDTVEPDSLYGNASAAIQDQAAEALYERDGSTPWSGDGC